jgi:hypothetical protein
MSSSGVLFLTAVARAVESYGLLACLLAATVNVFALTHPSSSLLGLSIWYATAQVVFLVLP